MEKAYLATVGQEWLDKTPNLQVGHAASFDANPAGWEETRQNAFDIANDEQRTLAEGISAAQELNEAFLEDGGQRLVFEKDAEGSTNLKYKQIWSDQEIEDKRKKDDEGLAEVFGMGLIAGQEEHTETEDLVKFLTDLYRSEMGEEPDAVDLGRAWFILLSNDDDEENGIDPETIKTFRALNEKHMATLPDDEEETSDQDGIENSDEVEGIEQEEEQQQVRSERVTNFCANCGNQFSEQDSFCSRCGEKRALGS